MEQEHEVVKRDESAEQPYELIRDDKGRFYTRNIRDEKVVEKKAEEDKKPATKKATKKKFTEE
jgi:hypothetical protein